MAGSGTILVVDDEADFAEALRVTLADRSYDVRLATNRAQAQQMAAQGEIDMVVLGPIAPRGDAFAFHQWLKRSPGTRDLPLMVLDAPREKQLLKGWRMDEGMQMEAEDYLAKPLEPAALVPRIQKLLDMAMERIRVLIADDHAVVREGLCAVLTLQRDMQVVGEAVDGREAVEKVRLLAPDVVLMDIVMPVMSGLEATKRISRECPNTKVLVLTQFDDKENVASAGHAGAWGFIPKRAASAKLLAGVRSVFRGQMFNEALAACA